MSRSASDLRGKWDRRHVGPPGAPDPFLVEQAAALRPGSVLDLACGTGRNALHLARLGFDVTAVDISPRGLAELRAAALAAGLMVATVEADLRQRRMWGPFDNAIVVNYLPPVTLMASVGDIVRPGGTLLLCTFTAKNGANFNPTYCLPVGAYADGLPHFRVVHRSENVLGGLFREGYVFQRRPQETLR